MAPPKSETVRLNKLIADSGLCSRRKADERITAGRVSVNGKTITELGTQVDPGTDRVRVDGKPLPMVEKNLYLVFHKPRGVVTTRSDERGRKTIYDWLPENYHAANPAGRLDRNTSGVLILSSDGDFLHHITHPSFHVPKTYRVEVDRTMAEKDIRQLLAGVELKPEDKPAHVKSVVQLDPTTYELVLITGLNRQIRRSLKQLGYTVKKLKRTAFGNIRLGRLKPGEVRPLTRREKKSLVPNIFK